MLIVVAIIAILIAISIPLIQSALDKAKHATDAANERAAKAIIVVASLDKEAVIQDSNGTDLVSFEANKVYAYNAKDGQLTLKKDNAGTYGKHHVNGYIAITMNDNGDVTIGWNDSKTALQTTAFTSGDTCSAAAESKHQPEFITTTGTPAAGGGTPGN